MGCDVHLFAEIKVAGKWLLYMQPRVDRCYALFEKMAGVRGDVREAIAPPRGIPSDASEATVFCAEYDKRDAHSHSWLDAREIAELCAWARRELKPYRATYMDKWDFEAETGSYLFGNSWEGFTLYPDSRPKGVEDVRFVFWFDN